MPDELDDDGYKDYDGWSYYYSDGRYERKGSKGTKVSPMMSPIISPVPPRILFFSNHVGGLCKKYMETSSCGLIT
jgi:hypothetical protein